MTKYFTINHFYWWFNQLDYFNSNWRKKCASLRKTLCTQVRNRSETFW